MQMFHAGRFQKYAPAGRGRTADGQGLVERFPLHPERAPGAQVSASSELNERHERNEPKEWIFFDLQVPPGTYRFIRFHAHPAGLVHPGGGIWDLISPRHDPGDI